MKYRPSLSSLSTLAVLGVLVIGTLEPGCAKGGATNGTGFGGSGGVGSGLGGGGASGIGGSHIGGGGSEGSGIILPPSDTCGNSVLDQDEQCDDGNKVGGDGCSAGCQLEADSVCPTVGMPCSSSAVCGNGTLSSIEACDDGNAVGGDGCSADCKTVEVGFQCRVPGKHCVPLCGDSKLIGNESCDDGNASAGDGCSSTCQLEPGWTCPTPGSPCTKSICGNGVMEAGESCDAGVNNGLFYGDGTGCSKTCTQEPTCRPPGGGVTSACATRCGDGNIDPNEGCDDGNQVNGDGCSSTCTKEAGFTCGAPVANTDTQPCTTGAGNCLVLPVTFRDFDGQHLATGHPDFFYYGATVNGKKTTCVPNASGGNLVAPAPQPGVTCPVVDATNPCPGLVASTLGPDGKPTLGATTTCSCTFTDWDNTGVLTGVAGVSTCSSGGAASPQFVKNVPVKVIQSAASFKQWYADSALSTKVISTLELAQVGATNQYQFSSSNGTDVYDDIHAIFLKTGTTLTSGFFPLEATTRPKLCNLWSYWKTGLDATHCVASAANPITSQWDPRASAAVPPKVPPEGQPVTPAIGMMRNFYFTSEVRYLFHYVGGESLAFFGDDDVWVFINGHLVLDLGAPHERMKGQVTLLAGGNSASWSLSIQNSQTGADVAIPAPQGSGTVSGLGLEVGKTYEIVIYHADQHPRESNYQLTISGYSTSLSSCTPTCGDGVTTAGEECDDGTKNDDALYGGCTTTCKFGPFCGDGAKNGPEDCDLGAANGAVYGMKGGCTAACLNAHYCGDGIVDAASGEACDAGTFNSDGGKCNTMCQLTVQ